MGVELLYHVGVLAVGFFGIAYLSAFVSIDRPSSGSSTTRARSSWVVGLIAASCATSTIVLPMILARILGSDPISAFLPFILVFCAGWLVVRRWERRSGPAPAWVGHTAVLSALALLNGLITFAASAALGS
ncbi:hypothetical protein ACTZWW_05825 [Salinarimonas sp. NSM]|uniref:hypothetical protein n=1 Tax=Salinarimonas sp. NSM TaxID=3458003 RepID=UPI00403640B8